MQEVKHEIIPPATINGVFERHYNGRYKLP